MTARPSHRYSSCLASILALLLAFPAATRAVQTTYITHQTEEQLKEGDTDSVLINSRGVISLGPELSDLLSDTDDWLINALAVDPDRTLYAATSGQGRIYRIPHRQEPQVIYQGDQNDVLHVFSLRLDREGRLLAGTGGNQARLLRYQGQPDQWQELWTDPNVQYIWDIVEGPQGQIYFGTGPDARLYALEDSQARVLYDSKEKNILALAIDDQGNLFAGGDEKGIIYRIDPDTGQAWVVYDSEHKEISALVFDELGNLYASTSDVEGVEPARQLILSEGLAGRPELQRPPRQVPEPEPMTAPDPAESAPETADQPAPEPGADAADQPQPETADQPAPDAQPADETAADQDDAQPDQPQAQQDDAQTEQTDQTPSDQSDQPAQEESPEQPRQIEAPATAAVANGAARSQQPARQGPSNEVFMIDPQGYVRSIFNRPVVILSMAYQAGGRLLLGTGNAGQVLALDVDLQEAVILTQAEGAVQAAAVTVDNRGTVYAGWANPAGIIALGPLYAREGTYTSGVVDGQQITHWGKLQVDASLAAGARVLLATRSGNTAEPDLGGWSDWSQPRQLDEDLEADVQPARYLQYRLTLSSDGGFHTPLVRLIKLAHRTANMAPVIASVTLEPVGIEDARRSAKQPPGYQIAWQAADANGDALEYELFVREVGRSVWIRIAKELEKSPYLWDMRTAADGRYEVRVLASDARDNAAGRGLTDARVSLPVVVDNTPPAVAELNYSVQGDTLAGSLRLRDDLSVVTRAAYTLDSAEDPQPLVPIDEVFDSRQETIPFEIKNLQPGEHLLSLTFEDALGNRAYKNLTFNIE